MAKGMVIRGTPGLTPSQVIRSGGAGINPQKPQGFAARAGTVPDQFEGSDRGPRQVEAETGQKYATPYHSDRGNPGDAIKLRADGTLCESVGGDGASLSTPDGSGGATMFDGMDRVKGYQPRDSRTTDSPVPERAPWFDTRTIAEENRAHLGGDEFGRIAGDDIVKIDGVMSRGMAGTSTPAGGEDELLEDDYLKNMGPGGAVGR